MSEEDIFNYFQETYNDKIIDIDAGEVITEDTHFINSYYIVDSDGEIKGDNLTKQEAKELAKQLKDTAEDYIYVTRNATYEIDGSTDTDFEDIVDVDIYGSEFVVHKDLFKLFSSKLQEGRADIYNQLEDEYFAALSRAEEKGIVTFTVDKDGEQEEEFDSFDVAVEYAKEIGKDKIHVSSFGECYGAYCDGEYEEYDEHILDLNRNIVENFNEAINNPYSLKLSKAERSEAIKLAKDLINKLDDKKYTREALYNLIDPEADYSEEYVNYAVNYLVDIGKLKYEDNKYIKEELIEGFKPIFYKDYTIEYDDEKTNSYIILNNKDEDATAGHMFKSIAAAKRAIDADDLAYPNQNEYDEEDDILDEKLIQSSSEEAFKKNVETEIEAGKDPKQAVAIAYAVKEKNEEFNEEISFSDEPITEYNGFRIHPMTFTKFEIGEEEYPGFTKYVIEKDGAYLPNEVYDKYNLDTVEKAKELIDKINNKESLWEDLEYDYNDIENWKEIFDIADEQEVANAFGKPVRGKDKTYYPIKKLTIEEVRQLALDNYENGGDVIIEAWTDEDIQQWIDKDGTTEGLLALFNKYNDQYIDMKGSGEYTDLNKSEEEIISDEEFYSLDDDDRDFGPSNPWDAPGMSIKDFLR